MVIETNAVEVYSNDYRTRDYCPAREFDMPTQWTGHDDEWRRGEATINGMPIRYLIVGDRLHAITR